MGLPFCTPSDHSSLHQNFCVNYPWEQLQEHSRAQIFIMSATKDATPPSNLQALLPPHWREEIVRWIKEVAHRLPLAAASLRHAPYTGACLPFLDAGHAKVGCWRAGGRRRRPPRNAARQERGGTGARSTAKRPAKTLHATMRPPFLSAQARSLRLLRCHCYPRCSQGCHLRRTSSNTSAARSNGSSPRATTSLQMRPPPRHPSPR